MDWSYVTGYFDGEGTAGVYPISRSAAPKIELSWHNSHLESLEEIRRFIGCGTIRHRKLTKGNKPMHLLVVQRKNEIALVVQRMLPHSLIKRDALQRVLDACGYLIKPYKRGILGAVGVEGIRAMYEDEHMSMAQIADRIGVTWTGVKLYMHRNGIPTRSPNDPIYSANKAWSEDSKSKLAITRTIQWQDPSYREKITTAMRAGQTKRTETRRRKSPSKMALVNVNTVRHLYEVDGLSLRQIGARMGVTAISIKRFMDKNDIRTRPPTGGHPTA